MMPSLRWLVVLALPSSGISVAKAQPGSGEAEPSRPEALAPATEPEAPPTRDEPSAEATAENPAPPASEASPSEPEPASPSEPAVTSEPASPSEPEPAPAPSDAYVRPPRQYPRLVLAAGPVVGPHAIGNEQCSSEEARCETKGSFLGLGAQLELRGRLWKLVYLHARGVAVSNVSPNDPIYRGLLAAGVGVGLYGRRAFGRGEYLYVGAFGDNHFEPPFFDGEVATDDWGHHAGMLSVGFRQPLPHRLAVELWGGLMLGPRSVRRIPQAEPDERVLTTFLVGLNLSWDALQ